MRPRSVTPSSSGLCRGFSFFHLRSIVRENLRSTGDPMMKPISDIDALEGLYDAPVGNSLNKVAPKITPLYRQWIEASRFVVLASVGPEGTDATPRGDDGPVVRVVDDKTLWLPDWQGNNRLDTLRNIVRDPRVSLMFLVPGCNNVIRANGTAFVTADPEACASFERRSRNPKTVIVITVSEVYYQCAKALMRSGLWTRGDESGAVPTAGAFLKEASEDFDSRTYDAEYAEKAQDRMW